MDRLIGRDWGFRNGRMASAVGVALAVLLLAGCGGTPSSVAAKSPALAKTQRIIDLVVAGELSVAEGLIADLRAHEGEGDAAVDVAEACCDAAQPTLYLPPSLPPEILALAEQGDECPALSKLKLAVARQPGIANAAANAVTQASVSTLRRRLAAGDSLLATGDGTFYSPRDEYHSRERQARRSSMGAVFGDEFAGQASSADAMVVQPEVLMARHLLINGRRNRTTFLVGGAWQRLPSECAALSPAAAQEWGSALAELAAAYAAAGLPSSGLVLETVRLRLLGTDAGVEQLLDWLWNQTQGAGTAELEGRKVAVALGYITDASPRTTGVDPLASATGKKLLQWVANHGGAASLLVLAEHLGHDYDSYVVEAQTTPVVPPAGTEEPFEKAAGIIREQGGMNAEAWTLMTAAAEAGHLEARFNLGVAYAEGFGVQRDLVAARSWLEKAGTHGPALNRLGMMAEEARSWSDQRQALDLFWRAAELGLPDGLCNSGRLVEKIRPRLAVRLYRCAGERGSGAAWHNLSRCHAQGVGLPKDPGQATVCLVKAMACGHTPAMLEIADAYRKGEGVEKDEAKAFALVEKAAQLGNVDGMLLAGRFLIAGVGTPVDEAKGREWLLKAKRAGSREAAKRLAALTRSQTRRSQTSRSQTTHSPQPAEPNQFGIAPELAPISPYPSSSTGGMGDAAAAQRAAAQAAQRAVRQFQRRMGNMGQ